MAKKVTAKVIRGTAPKAMKVPPSAIGSAISAGGPMGAGTNSAYSNPMIDTNLTNQTNQIEMAKAAAAPVGAVAPVAAPVIVAPKAKSKVKAKGMMEPLSPTSWVNQGNDPAKYHEYLLSHAAANKSKKG